jgi:hypothetical protein
MSRASVERRRRPDSGEALVEFALVLPILLVLSLGMLDFGRAFHVKGLLDQAAREGCRVAIVTDPDQAVVESRVTSILAAGGVTPNSVTVSGPNGSRMVEVKVQTTFHFITPGLFTLIGAGFGNTIEMTGQSTMRYEGGSNGSGGNN